VPHAPWAKNHIIQISLIGACGGQQIVNVHHFQANDATDANLITDALRQGAVTTLVNLWNSNEKTEWLAAKPQAYTLNMIRGQMIECKTFKSRRLVPVELTLSSGNAGTAADTTIDDFHTAGVIRWRSAIAGKSSRGRSYVGPLPDNFTNSGQLAAPGVTALSAYGAAMQDAYFESDTPDPTWRLTVYSRPYDYQEYGYVRGSGPSRDWYWPPDYNGDANNVMTYAIDTTLRTQRRREIGVGA
jgi:hypothetical protein